MSRPSNSAFRHLRQARDRAPQVANRAWQAGVCEIVTVRQVIIAGSPGSGHHRGFPRPRKQLIFLLMSEVVGGWNSRGRSGIQPSRRPRKLIIFRGFRSDQADPISRQKLLICRLISGIPPRFPAVSFMGASLHRVESTIKNTMMQEEWRGKIIGSSAESVGARPGRGKRP